MQPVDELFSLCSEQLRVIDAKEKPKNREAMKNFSLLQRKSAW